MKTLLFGVVMQLNTWCMAKPSARDADLQNSVEYMCKFVDCGIIQPGGKCFYPNMLISHASVAMNICYATMGGEEHNCDFSNSALISDTDPSMNHQIVSY